MKLNLTKRIEWLSEIIQLTEQEKEYILFQMKESIVEMVNKMTYRKSVFDSKIDAWHNDKETTLELHEYLGLTKEQYAIWLKNPDEIEKDFIK